MIERLKAIEERYNKINQELIKPEILLDHNKTKELSKELTSLESIITLYHNYQKTNEDLKTAEEMLEEANDEDLLREVEKLKTDLEMLENDIKCELIPKDPDDECNAIVEIRGAAGGDEANIFAGDLLRMYLKYAEKMGWKAETITAEPSDMGGFSLVGFLVKGKNVYGHLKFENGAHRVQRIPVTESQGRVHTSTATVLVMPQISKDIEVNINPKDLRIDIFHSSGAGGQSVNTTDSAVRITHLPTGIVVACQNERSQIQNKAKAMEILKSRIYNLEKEKQEKALGEERKNKIGTGDRSEKIRTYNYPQNRVTDHQINMSIMNLDKVMDGDLDEIINALMKENNNRILKGEDGI